MEKVIGFLEQNYPNVISTPSVAVWRPPSGGSAAVKMNSYKMMVVYLNGQIKGIGNTPDYVIQIIRSL